MTRVWILVASIDGELSGSLHNSMDEVNECVREIWTVDGGESLTGQDLFDAVEREWGNIQLSVNEAWLEK